MLCWIHVYPNLVPLWLAAFSCTSWASWTCPPRRILKNPSWKRFSLDSTMSHWMLNMNFRSKIVWSTWHHPTMIVSLYGKCLGCTRGFWLSCARGLCLGCARGPPFGLIYAQVCLAPDLYVIIPTPPHPTLLSEVSSSLSCSLRYHPHPTPPHPTPPFGLIYAQVCLAPDLYFIIPTPPHPCRYNWAQILDFVGTSETNTCRYKWVKSVGASEPLPSLYH